MQNVDLFLDQKELTFLIYGGQTEYENFIATKHLKNKYDFLKFRPETYAYESEQHLIEEGKVLLELIKLHKSNEINLKNHIKYIQDLTPYFRAIETHFTLFKNLALAFSSRKSSSIIRNLVDQMSIVGSVLMEEFDYNRNLVEDNVETIATYDPESKKILINTPLNKAKLCRFYTPHSTHVLVFARIKKSEGTLTSPYPFLISLRDPKTLELNQGILLKWMGPSFGGISGREYAIEFKDFAINSDKILLDKYITFNNNKLTINADDNILNYTIRLCLLLEQDQRISKSLREASKAAFLAIRHAHNRTQFQTLDEKGKERPIFEYSYNKTRIMKGLAEIINLLLLSNHLRKGVYHNMANPQNNFQRLNDLFTFYDIFEVYVNERCLITIEAFRESLGAIGYLKYSGIPSLQENAMKNAVLTGPSKELRYLRFAQYFVNLDLKDPGDFITHYIGYLTENNDLDQFSLKEGHDQKLGFYMIFLAKKLLYYKQYILRTTSLQPKDDCRKLRKSLANFDNVTKLCETFIFNLTCSCQLSELGLKINRPNQRTLLTILNLHLTNNVFDDLPFYVSNEGKLWQKGRLDILKENLSAFIQNLGKKSLNIVNSFEFDENLLNSCIAGTAEETYEKMLKMSKEHNPRNDPKTQEEIRKELLVFLNRPSNPKL